MRQTTEAEGPPDDGSGRDAAISGAARQGKCHHRHQGPLSCVQAARRLPRLTQDRGRRALGVERDSGEGDAQDRRARRGGEDPMMTTGEKMIWAAAAIASYREKR